jgi:hypothetical protein
MTDAQPLPAPSDPPLRGVRLWALVAEIVGAVAVVVSLVFVGLQVAESNELARSAATKAQIEKIAEFSRVMLQTPGTADLLAKTGSGQPLTPAEQIQLRFILSYGERNQEELYYQFIEGKIDPALWEAHRAQVRASQNNPYAEAFWEAAKTYYSPRYRAFREADMLKAPKESRSIYTAAPVAPSPEAPAEAPKQ